MSKKCPRGFTLDESSGKCIPEGSEIQDKLTMKYERYFFKESGRCESGYRWCPIKKQCIPDDDVKYQGRKLHRGQGKGPMGKPFKEADDLVDMAFDEGFEIFGKAVKAHKKVDRILDAIEEAGVAGRLARGAAGAAKGFGSAAKGVAMWSAADTAISGGAAAVAKMARKRKAKQMCKQRFKPGTPQMQQCIQRASQTESEEIDYGKGTINTTGRPYDHPRKMRVTADVDECDMMKHKMWHGDGDFDADDGYEDPNGGDEFMSGDSFEGEFDSGPSEDDEPDKISNDINHIPNQNGPAQYKSLRKQMGEGWELELMESIADKYRKRRCEKIKADIADFRKGFANCKANYRGEKLKQCLEPLRGGREGLVMQAKKWGCIK